MIGKDSLIKLLMNLLHLILQLADMVGFILDRVGILSLGALVWVIVQLQLMIFLWLQLKRMFGPI